jgi:predicted aldo/keto reductase-like oxidoreductase
MQYCEMKKIHQKVSALGSGAMCDCFSRRILVGCTACSYCRLASGSRQCAPNGLASLCTDCRACLPKCHIDIPSQLKKVDLVLGKRMKIDDVLASA